MDIEKIFSLMEKAEKLSFSKIEIQMEDMKISLERQTVSAVSPAPVFFQSAHQAPAMSAAANNPDEPQIDDILIAPISGVFYMAKEPGAAPFVKEGQHVRKGETVCIIEAMKMMNEICAPKSGMIERVLVADSEAITVGDTLFVYAKEN
jgi:acetyl-CoA carboxylase biotin carboxyl carrier protein